MVKMDNTKVVVKWLDAKIYPKEEVRAVLTEPITNYKTNHTEGPFSIVAGEFLR